MEFVRLFLSGTHGPVSSQLESQVLTTRLKGDPKVRASTVSTNHLLRQQCGHPVNAPIHYIFMNNKRQKQNA
jgi:hypothetical protein